MLCSEGNLKGRILGMFGAIGTSMEASKNSISPKVTALKRAKYIYCKTAFLVFLRLASSNCSRFSCDHYWNGGTAPRTISEQALGPLLYTAAHPYKQDVLQCSAPGGAVNYSRSSHQPRGIYLGILLREWERC